MLTTIITKCRFNENIITGSGIINSVNAHLEIYDSMISNNTFYGSNGINFNNATIANSTFIENTVDSGFGLIDSSLEKWDHTLQLKDSVFLHNHGNVIQVNSIVNTVLNNCNFTGNKGQKGILYIRDDGATLRIAKSMIVLPAEGNEVAVYFTVSGGGTKMTDLLTYDACFVSENITLNSSSSDDFLHETEKAGQAVIEDHGYGYFVTQEETVFASCKYSVLKVKMILIVSGQLKLPVISRNDKLIQRGQGVSDENVKCLNLIIYNCTCLKFYLMIIFNVF